jgi:[protein-PII] uridylyltransferase
LLFDLATAFAARDLDVHLAKVATYGPRVVDIFYVTDLAGQKLDASVVAGLEAALVAAASATA